MAILKAFKGLRPPDEIAKQLASRPYDVLNSTEARTEAKDNPYSLFISLNLKLTFRQEQIYIVMKSMIKPGQILIYSKIKDGWCKMPRNTFISMLKPCLAKRNMVLLVAPVWMIT